MKTFAFSINYNSTIDAINEDDVIKKILNSDLLNDSIIITELCPHCGVKLHSKMIDIDGTNIEEHQICPECGYGSPALL